jgi:hypothetical protein
MMITFGLVTTVFNTACVAGTNLPLKELCAFTVNPTNATKRVATYFFIDIYFEFEKSNRERVLLCFATPGCSLLNPYFYPNADANIVQQAAQVQVLQ